VEVPAEHVGEGQRLDAVDAVGQELYEVARMWHAGWPVCAQHDGALAVCTATWYCGEGDAEHDIALVGELESSRGVRWDATAVLQ
jgi:hypothetical protein